MRRWWSAPVVLAGSLLFLLSLYLPWQKATCTSTDTGSVLNLFGCPLIAGVSSNAGRAGALISLLLMALAVAALVRPDLEDRIPLGTCSVAMGYFALAAARASESAGRRYPTRDGELHTHVWTYVGVATAVFVLLVAAAPRAGELLWDRSPLSLARFALTAGLLVTFLLPWNAYRAKGYGTITLLGIERPTAVLAACCALLAPVAWGRAGALAGGDTLLLAATTTVLTGAALTDNQSLAGSRYPAWTALGLALALFVLTAARGSINVTTHLPSWRLSVAGLSAAIFVAGMFLPWHRECFSHQCGSWNGWTRTTTVGSAAAALAIALGIVMSTTRHSPVSAVEIAAGLGLLVATVGLLPWVEITYGSTITSAGAALLVGLSLTTVRKPKVVSQRVVGVLAPTACCLAYLIVLVVPWWYLLPAGVVESLFVAFPTWLNIAAALGGVHLMFLWLRRATDRPGNVTPLVFVPLFLLALIVAEVAAGRLPRITWGSGIIVGLCLVLTLFGYIERRDGFRNLRLPEILRIDRIEP